MSMLTALLNRTPSATPQTGSTSSTSSTSSSSSDSATISSSDFLTLLVTELKNQDPTADTDPNEYINQLVEVNSLEQLININQTLTDDLGSTSSTSGSASKQVTSATSSTGSSIASASGVRSLHSAEHAASTSQSDASTNNTAAPQPGAATSVAGNLSVPGVNASAERVASALSGH